jgi:hypothetical protein
MRLVIQDVVAWLFDTPVFVGYDSTQFFSVDLSLTFYGFVNDI